LSLLNLIRYCMLALEMSSDSFLVEMREINHGSKKNDV
jgi:hypothetical protein